MKRYNYLMVILVFQLFSVAVQAADLSSGRLSARHAVTSVPLARDSAAGVPAGLVNSGRVTDVMSGYQQGAAMPGNKSGRQGRAGQVSFYIPRSSERRPSRMQSGRGSHAPAMHSRAGAREQVPASPELVNSRRATGGIPVVLETRRAGSGPLMTGTDKMLPVMGGQSRSGGWASIDQGKKMNDGGTLYADGSRTDSHGRLVRYGRPDGVYGGDARQFEDKQGNLVTVGGGMLVQQQKYAGDRVMITDPRSGVTVRFGARPVEEGSSVGKGPEKNDDDSGSTGDDQNDASSDSQADDAGSDDTDENSSAESNEGSESSQDTDDRGADDATSDAGSGDDGGDTDDGYRGEGGEESTDDPVLAWLEARALDKRLTGADEDRPFPGPGCGPTGQPGGRGHGCSDAGAADGEYMDTGDAMVDSSVIVVMPAGGITGPGPDCFDVEGCVGRRMTRGMQTRYDDSPVVNPGGGN